MNSEALLQRLRVVAREPMPLPAQGHSAERHRRFFELGREDLSLARLAEAHYDAVAILAEAGREPRADAIYGVWAAEIPGQPLHLHEANGKLTLTGRKMFCSGATLLDHALVTAEAPEPWLIDVDIRKYPETITADGSAWKASAFAATRTATIDFDETPIEADALLGERGWYLNRPGFWHGAIGPAACWAGGAAGLVDYARTQTRSDPHTLAHLGAMEGAAWALQSVLQAAGDEMDKRPDHRSAAQELALKCRHIVEQLSMDILERFGRAYGPFPLAFVEGIGTRFQELTIYLRQCHAERDLAALGHLLSDSRLHAEH